MISPNDELKIYLNLMAQSPQGLDDPQLIGKFAKAKAFLHAQQSLEAMNNTPVMPPQATGGTMLPTDNNTPVSDGSMPQTPQNDPNQPNTQMGQGELQLPQ